MLLTRALVPGTDQRVMGPHDVRCRVGERIWTEAPARALIFISEVARESHVTRDRHSNTWTWSDRRSSGPHLVSSEMLPPVCCHMRLVISPWCYIYKIIRCHYSLSSGQQQKSEALLMSLYVGSINVSSFPKHQDQILTNVTFKILSPNCHLPCQAAPHPQSLDWSWSLWGQGVILTGHAPRAHLPQEIIRIKRLLNW